MKNLLAWIVSIVKWLVFSLVVWISKALAMLLAPVLVPFVKKDKNGVNQFVFSWIGTHDAGADAWWFDNYDPKSWIRKNKEKEDFHKSIFIRYYSRLMWVWRNPAYVVAHYLGYDQKGMVITKARDEGKYWDKGYPNMSYWYAKNSKGQIGWMFEWQYYYYKQYCLEVYFGWKLFRKDPDQKCMLVARIAPFKKYEKKEIVD